LGRARFLEDGLVKVSSGGESLVVRLEGGRARLGGRAVDFAADRAGETLQSIRVGNRAFRVRIIRDRDRVFVWCAGEALEFRKASGGRPARSGEAGGGGPAAPPGRRPPAPPAGRGRLPPP